jgi:uncharacterized OB-fold protein
MSTDTRFEGAGPDEAWRIALGEGRFLIQHCGNCGRHRFPPALVCLECGGVQLEWIEASGRGTVYATTTVRERQGSYNVSLIDLAEGPRMMSQVERIAPEAVRIGMAVSMRIVDSPPRIVFEPRGGDVA